MTAPAARPGLRGLYFVTPDRAAGRIALVAAALRGGARVVQYRDKSGTGMARLPETRELLALCRKAGALLLINDDVELCLAAAADGVHLGEDDAGIAEARDQLGPNRVIGASCYNDLDRARRAIAAGADYVAFGSVYPSPTKPAARRANPDLLRAARAELAVPICAIGGITPDNAAPVVAAGADMVAVIQAISEAPDPETAARALQALFP
ncbi:thiamine phosphate synthase [Thioalkalivibrio paradoxus]|uniref:Thiamine-phosphate synthase n=1 Tax=Thioalkalivibrio paradoxus ARh 1 TaxID=713585 RepID=W0DK19_9GAMM|nr:thiamine phosphate synthase [Thioalkalivibrio paradoxus]AHE97333.1 thiamine-phosphate pyrophosphorylase [Thioalkalivibrio paradoxus ARh 1]